MLTLSGLGAVSDEFMDCMAVDGDLELCQTLHPQSAPAVAAGSIWNSNPTSENACGYNAWWDGARCQPFDMPTAGMQEVTTGSGSAPGAGAVPTRSAFVMPKIPTKTIAIVGALGLVGFLLFKRKAA